MTNSFLRFDRSNLSFLRLWLVAAACFSGIAAAASAWERDWFALCAFLLVLAFLVVTLRHMLKLKTSINSIVSVLGASSNGDLNSRVVLLNEKGELGRMASMLNRTLDLAEAFTKEADAAMMYANKRKYFRRILPAGLRGNYSSYSGTINGSLDLMERRDAETLRFLSENVQPVALAVTEASQKMKEFAHALSATSEQTNSRAMAVSAASEQAAANVATVAAATEQLASSISEITRQVTESSSAASTAVGMARDTDATVAKLVQAADKIGDIVNIISDIARQTNLLALNATIEAARAGDAGKGFSVVANEVKVLAEQTAKATDEISSQVVAIRQTTQEAAQAIRGIGGAIEKISSFSGGIAAAVEQQSAATGEISRNVQEAATGTRDVSSNIGGVSESVNETAGVAGQVLSAAQGLESHIVQLNSEMAQFLGALQKTG